MSIKHTHGSAPHSEMEVRSTDHDQLTQLLSREGLAKKLKRCKSNCGRQSIIHLDLEHFGLINQKFGRSTGDEILRSAALRIRGALGERHLYCRPAGDELLVLLMACNKEDVLACAYLIQDLLEQPFYAGSQQISLNANIGIARYPHDTDNPEQLPDLAECALRQSKSRREPISFFSYDFHIELKRMLDVEQALKSAILNDELEIFLQPKYCFATQEIVGFEALLRWLDFRLGCVAPEEFVTLAERSLIGQQLDFYVLRAVSTLIAERKHFNLPTPPIAINISAGHFSDPDFANNLFATMDADGVTPSDIVLEVTEGVLMGTNGQALTNLQILRDHGFSIAIDDFGTGYSALSYLQSIPATELKIDKCFINDVETEQGKSLIRLMVNLAKTYKLSVTAEGIETKAQHSLLQSLGCDHGQGFYLAKPQPAYRALWLLKSPGISSPMTV